MYNYIKKLFIFIILTFFLPIIILYIKYNLFIFDFFFTSNDIIKIIKLSKSFVVKWRFLKI